MPPTVTSTTRRLLIAAMVLGAAVLLPVSAQAQSCTIFVDGGASGNGSGTQANPYTNLQDGLDDASGGDVVCVAEGTYNPPKKNDPFTMTGGTTLRGGYPNGFGSTTQDVENNPTILDGANVQQGGSSARRVLTVGDKNRNATTTIDGVSVENGNGEAGAGFQISDNQGTVEFIDATFRGNNSGSKDGGAVRISNGTVVFERVDFRQNISNKRGGALAVTGASLVEALNTAFVGNQAGGNGGGALLKTSTLVLEGVLVKGNKAQGDGGGLHTESGAGSRVVNATVSGNNAGGTGGGLYLALSGDLDATNSIVWNNAATSSASQVELVRNSNTLTWSYSDIEGSGGSGAWDSAYGTDGGNNIALNPLFVAPTNPSNAPTSTGDLHLGEGSSSVDSGNDGAVSLSSDLDGEQRIQDTAVDMGPYEGAEPLPSPEIIYVDQATGSDQNSGESWDQALATLQFALQIAGSNTEIWVADGVYYPDENGNTDSDDPAASFELKDRVSIYGGFAGNESSRSARDPDANLVVLSGDIGQDDASNADGIVTSPSDQNNGSQNNPTNAFHVLTGGGVSSQTVVDGVVITAGSADDKKNKDERPDEVGGGVFVNNGSPTLSDVRIVGNRAKLDGGGVASYGGGGPVLSESVIESNAAQRHGGGIYNAEGSGLRVRFVTLRGNTATERGGGIYNSGSNVRFTNVTVEGNETTGGSSRGGGIATLDSQGSVFTNLKVVGNRAAAGGGFFNDSGSATTILGTSTFSGNYAFSGEGGGVLTDGEQLDLENSIVWGNGPDQVSVQNSFNQQASLIEGGLNGALNQDPKFISDPTLASSAPTTDGDLHLQPTSPATDAGDQTLLPFDVSDIDDDGDTGETLPLDLAGSQRVKDGQVDIGAFEGTSLTLTVEGTYGADGADKGWRDMGVPVSGATVADVERGTGIGLENLSKWGVWRYTNDSWKQVAASDALPAGRGFTVYLFDKRESTIDPSLTLRTTAGSIIGDNPVTVGDGSPSADGSLSKDAEFHFLANPYAVPYDVAELESSGNLNGFQTVIQVWDYENGYQLIDLLFGDKTGITAWQAFSIERTTLGSGPTEVTFPSAGRLPDDTNTNPFFGSKTNGQSTDTPRFKLQAVARDAEGNELMRDEAASLLFHPDASQGWDRYDASKLTPPTNKYAVIGPVGTSRDGDSSMKARESRAPSPADDVKIPLGLKVKNYSGPLTISLGETVAVPESWSIILVDTKETADPSDDTEHRLTRSGEGYQFTVGGAKQATQRVEEHTGPVKQIRPSRAEPVDWSPPSGASGQVRTRKSAADAPEARFRLRIQKSRTLPVEMAGFEATIDGQRAQLNWETASETQNAGFRVQHQRLAQGDSIPAPNAWSSLGFVEGAGTSSSSQRYQFGTDPLKYGTHAFRLKQVDADGSAHYTDPTTVDVRLDGAVSISDPRPNPTRQGTTLDLTVGSTQEVSVQLFDVLGRRLRTVARASLPEGDTHTIRVDTGDLSSGTYFLHVKGEEFRKTRRVTVVR